MSIVAGNALGGLDSVIKQVSAAATAEPKKFLSKKERIAKKEEERR